MNSPNTGNRNKLLASGECFCPKAARNESKWSAMFSWFDFDTGCGRPADFGLCDSPNIGLHEAQAHHVYHSHWCLFTTQADWIQVERENHYISLYFTSETYPWYPLVAARKSSSLPCWPSSQPVLSVSRGAAALDADLDFPQTSTDWIRLKFALYHTHCVLPRISVLDQSTNQSNLWIYYNIFEGSWKFRSQTSDNMDSWKAEVRRVRREKIRRRCRCAKR